MNQKAMDWWILALHIIGRLAAPIFWFFIAEGYYYTHDWKKYALRLLAFAVVGPDCIGHRRQYEAEALAENHSDSGNYSHYFLCGLELHRSACNSGDWFPPGQLQKADDWNDGVGVLLCPCVCSLYPSCLRNPSDGGCSYHSAVENVQWRARSVEGYEMVLLCLLSPASGNLWINPYCSTWEYRRDDWWLTRRREKEICIMHQRNATTLCHTTDVAIVG